MSYKMGKCSADYLKYPWDESGSRATKATIDWTPNGEWIIDMNIPIFNNDEASPARRANNSSSLVISNSGLTFWILRPKNAAILHGSQIAESGGERSISPMQFVESVWTRFTSIRACSRWGAAWGSMRHTYYYERKKSQKDFCEFSCSLCKKSSDSVPIEANKFKHLDACSLVISTL